MHSASYRLTLHVLVPIPRHTMGQNATKGIQTVTITPVDVSTAVAPNVLHIIAIVFITAMYVNCNVIGVQRMRMRQLLVRL